MAKNAKKTAKFKDVSFTIQKSKFKELLALVLKQISSVEHGNTILNGVKMSVAGKVLTLVATNGSILLEVETELDETVVKEAEAVLVGVNLEKLALKKDYYLKKRSFSFLDTLEVTIQEKQTVIKDIRNNILYNIPHYEEEYPNYKKLFPDTNKSEDYTNVGINMALLSKLSALTQHGVPSVISFNKNPSKAIIINANYNGIKSRALVMPCIIRE